MATPNTYNKTSDHQSAEKSAEKSVPKPGIEVDVYADRLMEELFADVDRTLQGGTTKSPTPPIQPEYISLKQVKVPQIVLPPTMLPRPEPKTEIDVKPTPTETLKSAKPESENKSFDRILLGVAFTSLAITVGLWLISRGSLQWITLPKFASQPVATPPVIDPKAEADAKFLDYIDKSLNNIEQKALQQKQKMSSLPGTTPETNLPTIAVPATPPLTGTIAQALNRVAEAIEIQSNKPATVTAPPPQVVVIPAPVVPSPSPVAKASPTPATNNHQSNNLLAKALNRIADVLDQQKKTPQTNPTTVASVASQPQPNSVGAGNSPSPVSVLPPPPPPLGGVTGEAKPTESKSDVKEVEAAPPLTPHTLVGVLSLGDRSAALFEIDGVAQRIYVGETIGTSGWVLAEVKNQEAVIRKNGEVRSIFIGQKF